jgi:chorismate mutase
MRCRGVRGATTVPCNDADAILDATGELLKELIRQNGLNEREVASILFSCTPDLTAAFPARAARTLGWSQTPLLDCQQMAVVGALPLCIRVLIHWNTEVEPEDIRHVYLRGAQALRPDWAQNQDTVKRCSDVVDQ